MSFYFDDEPQSQTNGGEQDFCCINCGSTDYYVESVGGALCCTSCFTQSQQLTQENTELDIEEVQALAARTSSGRVFATKRRGRQGGGGQQEKKPLDEFDTSVPFPNLVTCLHGIQQVMKHCTERLCDLIGLSEETEDVKETVQKLWVSYLRAWTDGAEFYGKLHPEIRFSLRDCFLPQQYKTKIMKHLSHKAAQVVRAELDGASEEKKEESSSAILDTKLPARVDTDSESDGSDVEDDTMDHVSLSKDHVKTIRHFEPTYHNPKSLMWMYWNKGKRGRLESALVTLPSMNFVACLLWLAVSRAGVTLNHVLTWIVNGALPLQNAFVHCLSNQEQEALTHVASFFRISKLPTIDEMETLTDKLVVACGLKSFAHLHGMPHAALSAAARPNEPDAVASKDGETKEPSTISTEIRKRSDFSYVTPRSVPLLTARLVDDLGFGQDVLDRTLALMGILKHAPSNLWLPAPLQMALPKNLGTTAQVLAVIAVACRMTPGWETWIYPGPTAPRTETTTDVDIVASSQQVRVDRKRQRVESEARRFVPYNEDHLRLLRNGQTVEGYLDFLEGNVLDEKESIFPNFRSTLDSSSSIVDGNDSDSTSFVPDREVVEKPPVLKAPQNPLGPQRIWRRQKMHDWKLRVHRKRAQWADANGLGDYVIYNDPLSHAQDRKRVGKKTIPIPEPFHPQYGLLLEYMSFTTNVKPSKIHEAITVLDDEILSLVNPDENSMRRRKRRKQPPAPQQETNEAALSSVMMNVEAAVEGMVPGVDATEKGGNDLSMVAV